MRARHAPPRLNPARPLAIRTAAREPWAIGRSAFSLFYSAVVYLQHRLARAGIHHLRTIGVLPTVDGHLRDELCIELRAAFPDSAIEIASAGGDTATFDVIVIPFTRSLYRRFLREKTLLVARGRRINARALLFYDIAHRRTDVVPRGRLLPWYARRLVESLIVLAGRRMGWRKS